MMRESRRIHGRGHAVAALGFAATAALLVAAAPARAELTVDHEPGSGGCVEAAGYFPEDQSREATRARQRCRLELFDQRIENDRTQKEAQADKDRDKIVQSWMDKQNVPARIFSRIWLDGYLGGGVTTYGLAGGVVILPWLEAELSMGRRDLDGYINNGTAFFQDSRTCWGGRFKGYAGPRQRDAVRLGGRVLLRRNAALTSYGNITTFPGAGPTGANGPSAGSATAHLVGAGGGVTWTDNSGLHASLEYIFSYAFYSQAVLNDMNHTEDSNLTTAWSDRLATERNGFRVQVGYAF